jgi:hypothetical protein
VSFGSSRQQGSDSSSSLQELTSVFDDLQAKMKDLLAIKKRNATLEQRVSQYSDELLESKQQEVELQLKLLTSSSVLQRVSKLFGFTYDDLSQFIEAMIDIHSKYSEFQGEVRRQERLLRQLDIRPFASVDEVVHTWKSCEAQETQLCQILGIHESNAALRQGAIIQSVTQLKTQEQEISELLRLRKRQGIMPAIEGLAAFREQLCSLFGVPVAHEPHATTIEEVHKKPNKEDQVRYLLQISAEADLVRAVRKLSKVGQDDIEEMSIKVTEGDAEALVESAFTNLREQAESASRMINKMAPELDQLRVDRQEIGSL